MNHILETNPCRGALIEAFYGIRWGHIVSGLSPPTENPFLKFVFQGCQRLAHTKPVQKKDPISAEMIKELVDAYRPKNDIPCFRFLLIIMFGFTGFLRIDETLEIQLKHLSFEETHLKILIEKSKTDQLHEGNILYISRLQSQYCPVKILEEYLNLANLSLKNDKETFLIPRIMKCKRGYTVSRKYGISYTRAREIFKEFIQPIKNERSNFGLHSLRSGGASAAAQNGVSDRLISKHGRWACEKSRNGYIKDSTEYRIKVTQNLGL